VTLQELDRVQADQPTHAVADEVDAIDLELLADRSQVRGELLCRAPNRREVEGPVRITEHHAPVGLEPTRQREHGPARAHETVHEHDRRQLRPRPRHVRADLVALHEVAPVFEVIGDDADRVANTVLEAFTDTHPWLECSPPKPGDC
jgi:hypothetical protein